MSPLGHNHQRLGRGELDKMKSWALASVPREGCGLIVTGSVVGEAEFVASGNVAMRGDDYQIDPAVQHRQHMRFDASGVAGRIVGVFHSHVERDARPSGLDYAMAQVGLLYVVYSVRDDNWAFAVRGPRSWEPWVYGFVGIEEVAV